MAATGSGYKAAARLQGTCESLRAGISLPLALLHCRAPPPVAGTGARGPRLGQESEALAGWQGLCECQSGCGLPLLLQETASTGSAMRGDTPTPCPAKVAGKDCRLCPFLGLVLGRVTIGDRTCLWVGPRLSGDTRLTQLGLRSHPPCCPQDCHEGPGRTSSALLGRLQNGFSAGTERSTGSDFGFKMLGTVT